MKRELATAALVALNSRTFSSLRKHRNYRLFWLGQLISLAGTWVQSIAQAWLITELSPNPVWLGVVAAAQFTPVLLLGLFGGVLADALPKHRALVGTQVGLMALALVQAGLVATGLMTLPLLILMAVLLGVILLAETANALFHLNILSLSNLVSVASEAPATDAYGHTNILLLGKGDATHDGIDLTDTMMIASMDPKKTKSVVMLSIPRDLYLLSTEKMGQGKINTMYRDYKISLIREGKSKDVASKLALKELATELGKALDIQIHGVAIVDFSGFTEAVDALGGVDVDVQSDLVDTEYPADETSYTTFSIAAGHQHLDGETALKYARSRHSTSDFGVHRHSDWSM